MKISKHLGAKELEGKLIDDYQDIRTYAEGHEEFVDRIEKCVKAGKEFIVSFH